MADSDIAKNFLVTKLELAVRARDLEITLQWSRGTYFGALLLAAAAGYWISVSYGVYAGQVASLSLAMFFSACWVMVTYAGRYWQTLWEERVALIEKHAIGELYGVPEADGSWDLLGPGFRFSPSRLALVVSISTCAGAFFALLVTLIVGPRASTETVNAFAYVFFIVALIAVAAALWSVWPRREKAPALISEDNKKKYLAGPPSQTEAAS